MMQSRRVVGQSYQALDLMTHVQIMAGLSTYHGAVRSGGVVRPIMKAFRAFDVSSNLTRSMMDAEEQIREIAEDYDFQVGDIQYNERDGDAANQWVVELANGEKFKVCDTALYKVEVEANIRRLQDLRD